MSHYVESWETQAKDSLNIWKQMTEWNPSEKDWRNLPLQEAAFNLVGDSLLGQRMRSSIKDKEFLDEMRSLAEDRKVIKAAARGFSSKKWIKSVREWAGDVSDIDQSRDRIVIVGEGIVLLQDLDKILQIVTVCTEWKIKLPAKIKENLTKCKKEISKFSIEFKLLVPYITDVLDHIDPSSAPKPKFLVSILTETEDTWKEAKE